MLECNSIGGMLEFNFFFSMNLNKHPVFASNNKIIYICLTFKHRVERKISKKAIHFILKIQTPK